MLGSSTTAPTSKPKASKKTARKPQPKVVRGKDGKFKSAKA